MKDKECRSLPEIARAMEAGEPATDDERKLMEHAQATLARMEGRGRAMAGAVADRAFDALFPDDGGASEALRAYWARQGAQIEREKRERLERFTLAAMQGLCAYNGSAFQGDDCCRTTAHAAIRVARATLAALDEEAKREGVDDDH